MPTKDDKNFLVLRARRLASFFMVCLVAGTTQAAPLFVTDLSSPFTQSGIAQQDGQIALGSGLKAVTLSGGVTALDSSFNAGTKGVLGANAAGGITFADTSNILVGPAVRTASTKNFGLAGTSDIAFSAGFWVGIGTNGGLVALDPLSDTSVEGTSNNLLDTHSELVGLSLSQGEGLFGQTNSFSGAVDGLLGVTTDGSLRFVQTTNGAFGGASMVSRQLGFVADGGLAQMADFIVGVNAKGSLNAYDPFLDLLFSDIGPSGLFSLSGGLEAFTVNADGLDTRFSGDNVSRTSGVLGVAANGGLAYVRIDTISSPTSQTDSASTDDLGIAANSGLAITFGTTVNALGAEPQSVPEPSTPALFLAAGLVAMMLKSRRRSDG